MCFCWVFALIRWYHLKRTFCFCQFLHWSSGITALVRWYHLKRTVRFCQFLHWSGGITGRELFLLVFAPSQMVLPEENSVFLPDFAPGQVVSPEENWVFLPVFALHGHVV